ncbi:hypothetical protein [Microbacterium sediminis]|nr:hypothetical protein [Microbacterium sediminis]
MRRRVWLLPLAAAVACAVAACGPVAGYAPTHAETEVPAALEASDLEIVNAEASVELDGFSRYLAVVAQVERDTIEAGDLSELLTTIVDVTGKDADLVSLTLGVEDMTSDMPVADPGRYVDLQTPATELGFDKDDIARGNKSIRIPWDDLVSFTEE